MKATTIKKWSTRIVERFNKIIDDEWHQYLIQCETLNEMRYTPSKLIEYYNFERYMHYGELSNKEYNINHRDRYMIPFKSISTIFKLYDK